MTDFEGRCVVIGSNCFTGSHIVQGLIERKMAVVGVSRSEEYDDIFLPYRKHPSSGFEFHQIDLVRQFDDLRALLEEIRPEIVINVAALSEVGLSNERPLEYFETNTVGVVRLCDYLRSATYLRRYLHISSAEVYGTCEAPVDESTLFNPSTPYAVSKAAADMYLATLRKNYSFPYTSIRTTNVYGVHQQLFKIIPRTIIYLKLGKPIPLHGGGLAIKSFVHIRDVVDGLLRVIDSADPDEVYHFSTDDSRTVADIVALVCRSMGHDPETATVRTGERLGQDARYWLDWSKASEKLGWFPEKSMEAGVQEIVGWIENSWDQINEKPLDYTHKT